MARAWRRVLDLAVLGVVDRLAEAALVGFLVDLGAARLVAAAHHVDHRLLAAHQLAHDRVDQAFVDQRLQSLGWFHVRKRNALVMTDTELRLIASAAIIGDSSQPVNG